MKSFTDAVTGQSGPVFKQLVITSDWDKTLFDPCADGNSINEPLLVFLSDAKRAGHRVIITSTENMDKVSDLFCTMVQLCQMDGLDLVDGPDFEFIGKDALRDMGLKTDYSFDDNPICGRANNNYVTPYIEITVKKNFETWPLSIAQLRERIGLSASQFVTPQLKPTEP